MNLSFCVTGKYPDTGQPPACYYNNVEDFIALNYTDQQTIILAGMQFDYDKNGNSIQNGPNVKGNISSIRMAPNGWTDLYTTDACGGNQGVLINGSANVDDPSNQISCMRIGTSMPWSTYLNQCKQGIEDQDLCQQYVVPIVPIVPIPDVVISDPNNNRWWLYVVLGIFLLLCILLVISGAHVTSKPKDESLLIKAPVSYEVPSVVETLAVYEQIPPPLPDRPMPSKKENIPKRPIIPSVSSYYKID